MIAVMGVMTAPLPLVLQFCCTCLYCTPLYPLLHKDTLGWTCQAWLQMLG